MMIAAGLAIAVLGAGAFVALGSKKSATPAEPVRHLASAAPTPPTVRQPVIPEPILSSPTPQPGATATAVNEAAQKKAFEDAVKQKLHAEMMKLQSDYTKQLQQQQSRNAPVPAAPAPAPVIKVADSQAQHPIEERSSDPSAAQLDMQRQRENVKPQDGVAQAPPPATTPAPVPVQQQQQAAVIPEIHEGDVVDVSDLDVVPKRTRDPHVIYPPMAARQKIETTILMSVLVSETGDVTDVKILRGDERFGFNDAAVRALRGARYSPAMKSGKRVKTWLPQMIQFKPGA